MSAIAGGEVVAAREVVLRRSLALLLARGDQAAEVALYFACRRLVRSLDANLARQPRGWRDDDGETTGRDVSADRETVLRRSLTLLLAERSLALTDDSVPALMRAESALYFACRWLVRVIDADPQRQPRGWRESDREAARS